MKLHAVIFDLFGTLVDDFSASKQMWIETAAALSVPAESFIRLWEETSAERTIGAFATIEDNLRHVCGAMAAPAPAEQIARAIRLRLEYTRRALEPRPDAVATLRALKERGYALGLISNCSAEVPRLWRETDFSGLIDAPVFSCAAGLKKPNERIYRLACERLGVAPELCLYVADGENYELAGAVKSGLQAVLIRTPAHQPEAVPRQEAGEWTGPAIATLADIFDLIEPNGRV